MPKRGIVGYTAWDGIDITRGSGTPFGQVFAPSRGLLNAANSAKNACKGDEARLDEVFQWYRVYFLDEMRASYRASRRTWDALLRRPEATILCYCGTVTRCHRTIIAAEILPRLGAVYGGERSVIESAHAQR